MKDEYWQRCTVSGRLFSDPVRHQIPISTPLPGPPIPDPDLCTPKNGHRTKRAPAEVNVGELPTPPQTQRSQSPEPGSRSVTSENDPPTPGITPAPAAHRTSPAASSMSGRSDLAASPPRRSRTPRPQTGIATPGAPVRPMLAVDQDRNDPLPSIEQSEDYLAPDLTSSSPTRAPSSSPPPVGAASPTSPSTTLGRMGSDNTLDSVFSNPEKTSSTSTIRLPEPNPRTLQTPSVRQPQRLRSHPKYHLGPDELPVPQREPRQTSQAIAAERLAEAEAVANRLRTRNAALEAQHAEKQRLSENLASIAKEAEDERYLSMTESHLWKEKMKTWQVVAICAAGAFLWYVIPDLF